MNDNIGDDDIARLERRWWLRVVVLAVVMLGVLVFAVEATRKERAFPTDWQPGDKILRLMDD